MLPAPELVAAIDVVLASAGEDWAFKALVCVQAGLELCARAAPENARLNASDAESNLNDM